MSDRSCSGVLTGINRASTRSGAQALSNPQVLFVGGEDHYLRIPFLLRLREHGFRVAAAGSGDSAPFAKSGIDFHSFSFERFVSPIADRASVRNLAQLFKELRPELVQSFDTKPNLLVPLASREVRDMRVVRTINGLGWLYSSSSPAALALRPIYCSLQRITSRWTAATVFQNRQDHEFFRKRRMTGSGIDRLIPGSGIDIDHFHKAGVSGPAPEQLRAELDLEDCDIIVTVSRLTRQKGIPTLLQAAKLVHHARPTARFLLVGSRESEGPFAVSQAELDRHSTYVKAVGQRSDVPTLLRLADIFAFPTEYREGVPRALLEAALAGLPIVATSMPGCSDVVKDGWSGFLVPPGTPEALASRILDLLQDRQTSKTMGMRAAMTVREEFGLDLTVTRYAALYTELIKAEALHRPIET
jgi:glycosyltransferase involved in cell wall biosynthesis